MQTKFSKDLDFEKATEIAHYIKIDVDKYADILLNMVESREVYDNSNSTKREQAYSPYDIALIILKQTTVSLRRKAYEVHEQWLKDNGYIETETDWKDIPGYSRYQVSRYGHVRVKESGAIMQPGFAETYPRVNLIPDRRKGVSRVNGIHVYQLVADAFVDKIPGKTLPDHINENPLDSRAENLQWSDSVENSNLVRTVIRKVKTLLLNRPIIWLNHYFPSREYASKLTGVSLQNRYDWRDYNYKIDGEQFPGLPILSNEEIKELRTDKRRRGPIRGRDISTNCVYTFDSLQDAAQYIKSEVKQNNALNGIVGEISLALNGKGRRGKPYEVFGYEWQRIDVD